MNRYAKSLIRLVSATALLIAALPMAAGMTRPPVKPVATDERTPCSDHRPLRQALFGDLHVHTAFSMDAWTFDTRTTPDGAYRFAKGQSIAIAPLDSDGKGSYRTRLARPLDFMAVTDHAENLGGVALCTRPKSAVYNSKSCVAFRAEELAPAKSFHELVQRVVRRNMAVDGDEVCGADNRACRDAIDGPWRDTQAAAEAHYDRSGDCSFTTFVAYEYSLSPELSKVHRNIIFRNAQVLPRPIHALAEPEPLTMLRRLRDECIDGLPGCDVLSIPHNPNLSDARMFRSEYPGTQNPMQEARAARLRANMEPVVEMMQVKGGSECRNGLAGVGGPPDEFCDFEKMRNMQATPPPDCNGSIGSGALMGKGCVDRRDFVRYALAAGLQEKSRIGANPFQFGFIGSTDAHDGTAGNTEESAWADPAGFQDSRPQSNPGGLVGVWAEENSREAIFTALRRREVFGTSGTRIQPRLFTGDGLTPGLCNDPEMLKKAYSKGVPMGSEMTNNRIGERGPGFLASALRDPGSEAAPGSKLQRLQIIKVWSDDDGIYQQRVYDVAGTAPAGEQLDQATCAVSDAGYNSLCGVWHDPSFDPARDAVYYARALEMPSCRWTTHRCNAQPDGQKPAYCSDPLFPKTIQERAWTSPIWYNAKP